MMKKIFYAIFAAFNIIHAIFFPILSFLLLFACGIGGANDASFWDSYLCNNYWWNFFEYFLFLYIAVGIITLIGIIKQKKIYPIFILCVIFDIINIILFVKK